MTISDLLLADEKLLNHSAIAIALPQLKLTSWLSAQKVYPKVYWQGHGSVQCLAALGSIASFPSIPYFSHTSSIRFFGGQAFSQEKADSTWNAFPGSQFWVPQFELIQDAL